MTIEDLLRESFAAHESLADPARAQEIARTTPPRTPRWQPMVAAAAVVSLVAGGAATVGTVSVHGPAHPPAGRVASGASNLAAARAVAARLIHALPMPPGADELTSAPTPPLAHQVAGSSVGDPRLTRTTWWRVPMDSTEFLGWLETHAPRGLRYDDGGGSSGEVSTRSFSSALAGHDGTDAYGPQALEVAFVADGDHTAVRIDAEVAGRFARTAATLAGPDVTGAEVQRILVGPGGSTSPVVHLGPGTGLQFLQRTFDSLRGTINTPGTTCGGPPSLGAQVEDRITFHTGDGDLVAALGASCSGPDVSLARHGQPLPAQLEAAGLDDVIAQLVDTSAPPPAASETPAKDDAAAAEAARLLHALPLPSGSEQHGTSPIPALQHGYVGTSTSDSRLALTTWWTVPVSDAKFSAWLSRHRPTGTQVDEMGVDSSHSNYAGRDVDTTIYRGPATSAWGPTTVVVTHATHQGETAVRIDVGIAARFARTSATLAGDQVASITITRTVTGTGVVPGSPLLHDRSVTITQPHDVAALGTDFDRLRGALDTPGMLTGGLSAPVSDPQISTYRVTFRSAGSQLTTTWVEPDYSGIPVATLSRDGRELTATLDLGTDGSADAFLAAVQQALGS